jgi:ankyrin repeat protein
MSKGYSDETKKFINLSDSNGKTALHYAASKYEILLVRELLEYKAITIIRDYKGRKSSEITGHPEIDHMIQIEEDIYTE